MWQPIETAPRGGLRILAADSTGFIEIVYWPAGCDYPVTDSGDCPDMPLAYWMHLPAPPEAP